MATNKSQNQKEQDLASYGKESFKLEGQRESSGPDKVVLNIQEASEVPIEVQQKTIPGFEPTGNPILDLIKKMNLYMVNHSKVKVDVKATFFHLLGVMVNSGIPMIKALKSLVAQSEKSPKMKIIIQEMADNIAQGASLSKAMLNHLDVFTEQEIGMIEAGEASGQISRVLDTLARDTEKASSIKKKIKSALTYPVVIFLLLIAVVTVMLVYVIPQLTDLFANAGSELPLITRIVVAMSDFLIEQKAILIVGVLILVGGFIFMQRTEKGRYVIDKVKISIPIFGELFKKSYLSRFSRSLSNLLESAVSIVRTMEITANSIGNEVYRKRLLLSAEDIKQGIPLAENLTESPLFPPMLVSMIDVGERTAQLDTITAKVADFYENEVDTAVAGLSKIIEPIMLIIIGLSVGAIVAAIILPIMQLTDIAGAL
ncbi:type II secretion system F family protein [Candidatus Peregrinibacteria bacterium]|nr:type II secretion system F family protein [Candidatus Peregrinibacteria bacterium]